MQHLRVQTKKTQEQFSTESWDFKNTILLIQFFPFCIYKGEVWT